MLELDEGGQVRRKKFFLADWLYETYVSHQGRRMDVSENVRLTVMNGYWHLGHKSSTFVRHSVNLVEESLEQHTNENMLYFLKMKPTSLKKISIDFNICHDFYNFLWKWIHTVHFCRGKPRMQLKRTPQKQHTIRFEPLQRSKILLLLLLLLCCGFFLLFSKTWQNVVVVYHTRKNGHSFWWK